MQLYHSSCKKCFFFFSSLFFFQVKDVKTRIQNNHQQANQIVSFIVHFFGGGDIFLTIQFRTFKQNELKRKKKFNIDQGNDKKKGKTTQWGGDGKEKINSILDSVS